MKIPQFTIKQQGNTMTPVNGKTYKIDYWHQISGSSQPEEFYKGKAVCLDDISQEEDKDGNPLYLFQTDNDEKALFAEEDIIEEINA